MKTEFDIQLHTIDMYRYNLYHTYTTASGYLAILIAVIALAAAVRKWGEVSLSNSVMYVMVGIILLIYTPLTLYLRSKQQVQGSPVLKNILHYTIDDTGITTSQGEMSSTLAWEQVYRVVDIIFSFVSIHVMHLLYQKIRQCSNMKRYAALRKSTWKSID